MMALNHKGFRLILAAGLTALMLTQFNSCSSFEEGSFNESSLLEVNCVTEDCVTPTLENLEITPNLGGGSEYAVPANLTEWNLGGDCNEGGFAYNVIVWELYLNGTKVRDSGMTGMAGGNSTVNSRCINGRYLLYFNMSAISQDNVNRTGLNTGSTRSQYDLYVEIIGQATYNGSGQRNPLKARRHISLVPI
ncbi:MAG: hypothetical protein KF799_11515 [Bdellovibrionales bacterium]|nr:hypothetical protein [Bdellovibrionales bacterium]